MLIIRNLQNQILQLNNEVKAFFLKGVNQSGKTTLLKNLASPDRKYADLAEPALRSLANEEPVLFLQRYAPPVLIDNIQYAPELVPVIKDYVLKHGKPGDFWLIVPKEDAETITAIMHELGDKFACLELCGLSSAELDGRESTAVYTRYAAVGWSYAEPCTAQRGGDLRTHLARQQACNV